MRQRFKVCFDIFNRAAASSTVNKTSSDMEVSFSFAISPDTDEHTKEIEEISRRQTSSSQKRTAKTHAEPELAQAVSVCCFRMSEDIRRCPPITLNHPQ